jgi:hypothetical protein
VYISYKELWDGLFEKANKIYYLNNKKFIELIGLEKWKYKIFSNIIYTWDKLFFERLWEYTNINFKTDFETFELIQWTYFQDKNNIYYINDFHKTVKTLKKWKIEKIEWCFDSFIIIENTLYKAGNGSWWKCDTIPNTNKKENFINL